MLVALGWVATKRLSELRHALPAVAQARRLSILQDIRVDDSLSFRQCSRLKVATDVPSGPSNPRRPFSA